MNLSKRINSIYFLLMLAGLGGTLIGCQQAGDEEQEVLEALLRPPFEDLNPEFQSFSIDNAFGDTIQFKTGSTICIPAGIFVDAAGQAVSGIVDFQYRELHDAVDLYLAGVPMTYGQGAFQTAGSFEMRAEQTGQTLQLDSTKMIAVRMASFRAGDDYQFYYLDEDVRAWDSIGTAAAEVNVERVKLGKAIERRKPRLKFPLNRQFFAFNYKGILDVYYNNNLTNVNHNYTQKKMKNYGLGWEDVFVHSMVDYQGKSQPAALMVWKNVSRKKFPKWTEKLSASLEQLRGKRYRLKVSLPDSSQVFSTQIELIMPLKALFAYGPGYWKKDYEAKVKKIEAAYAQMQDMAEVYREFRVQKLGVYNWDKLIKDEKSLQLAASFQFPATEDPAPAVTLHREEIIYVTGDSRGIIYFPKSKWHQMALIPDDKARLFTILPERKIAIYPADKYAEIEFDELRTQAQPSYTFDMELAEAKLESAEQLRALLEMQP